LLCGHSGDCELNVFAVETLAAVRKPCFAVWITAPTFATVIGWNTTVEKSAEKIEAPTGAGFKLSRDCELCVPQFEQRQRKQSERKRHTGVLVKLKGSRKKNAV